METVLEIIHFIGIISFSAAGAMVAIDNETDWFGVVFLSVITCFGGGLIRDIIAGQSIGRELPVVLTSMNTEIIVSISTATLIFLLAYIFKRKYVEEEKFVDQINNVLDAFGIGVFSAAGTAAYMALDVYSPLVPMVLGMISSIGGSITRDVILGKIPVILCKRIYALATLAGSAVYYITAKFIVVGQDYCDVVSTVACIIVIVAIRMCATVFEWNMPKAIDFAKIRSESEENESEIADFSLKK